jgi:protein-tyrosine-phosphatase
MKKLQILIIAILLSLSICALASMQAKAQPPTVSMTFQYTVSDGSPTGNPNVAYILDEQKMSVAATTGGATVLADVGSTWTYDNPTSSSSGSERWQASVTPTGTVPDTATTEDPTYYHQYTITFGYSTSDSSNIANTLVVGSYYQFGDTQSITSNGDGTVSPASAWVDAGTGMVSYQTATANSGTERWALSSSSPSLSMDVTSTGTLSASDYYHQYSITPYYTVSDSSTPVVTNVVGYMQFNDALTATPTKGSSDGSAVWVDAGTAVTYTSPISGGVGERWRVALADVTTHTAIASVSSSTTATVEYYHQYQQTLSYSVSGSGSPTAPTLTSTQFGVSYTPTLGTSLVTYWLDSGQSWSVTNPLGGSGSSEQWISSQTVSGSVSASSPTTAGTGTLTFAYQNQWKVTFQQSGVGTDAGSNTVLTIVTTVGTTNYGRDTLPQTNIWVDDGTTFSYAGTVSVSGGTKQYAWTSNTGGLTSPVHASGTVTGNYVIQYLLTVNDGGHGSASGSGWFDSGGNPTFSITPTTVPGATGVQYVFAAWSGDSSSTSASDSIAMTGPMTVTATWTTQYEVSFSQTGVGSDAGTNTVLTLGGVAYAWNALPSSVWVDSGTTFSWSSPVAGVTGERFVKTGDNSGLVSPITTSGTEAATYTTQFQVTFSQTGIDADGAGVTVLTVGSAYHYDNLPSTWFDSGASYTWADPVTVSGTEQFAKTGGSSGSISGSGTISATYQKQWKVTFTASGGNLLTDSSATIVTVGGAAKASSALPFTTGWINSGGTVTWEYSSPVASTGDASGTRYSWSSTSGLGQSGQSGTLTVTAAGTVTGTYTTQYYLTVTTVHSTTTGTGWYDSGDTAYAGVASGTVSGGAGIQYVFTSWGTDASGSVYSASDGITMSGPKTASAGWKTQYQVTFSSSGLGGDATGNLVSFSVSGGSYSGATSPIGVSGGSIWVDSGASVTYSFVGPVTSSATGKQYRIGSLSGPGSPITVSAANTVSESYVVQWQVSFSQTGVNSSAGSNAVLTVGSTNYAYNALPSNLWFDSGTAFSWASPVSGGSGTQFVLTGSSGSSPISAAGTYSATYNTQYQVTFVVSPSGSGSTSPAGANVWEDAGSLGISAIANSGYSFSTWSSNTGSITFNNANSASTTATISGSGIITSNFLFALDHFVFNAVAAQTAGSAFSITVTAVDASGNTVTSYSGTPTLTYSAGSITPSSATGGFSSGVWTGSVTVTAAGSSVIITATDGSYTGTSNSFTVAHASSVDHITVSLNPTTVAAPGTVTGTATAIDSYGNSWDVSALASWSIIGGGDGGSWSSNVYTSHTAGTYTVQGAYSSKTTTATLTVTAGALATVTVSGPTSVTAGGTATFTATGYDAQGNSLGVQTASWSISSGAAGSWSSNVYTSHTASATGTPWTVTATVSSHSGTASLTVTAAGAASFVVSGFPSPTVAGVAHSVTVTAKDVYGNTATGYTGTVAITSSDSQAVLPASAGLTSGIGSFTVTLKTAGTQSITATDTVTSLVTGSQTGITVNVASGIYFVVSGFPSPTVAGVAHSVTVIAYDAYGNVATGYTGTVAITSSDSQAVLPASAGLTSGIGSFTVTLKTAGTQSITATDTVTSSITGLQNGITVTAAGLDHIVISPASPSIVAGNSQVFTAEAFDQYGNSLGGVTSSVTFTAPGATVTGNSVYATAVSSYTVTATYNGKSDSTTLMVNAGALDHFVVGAPTSATAGSAFTLTVTAKDAYGNTVTSYTGTPSLTVSAGSISPATMNAFVNGVGSTSVTVTVAGSGVTIRATDGSYTGTSNSFTVNPTITASAGANGAISPSGSVSVNYGDNQTFTITANTGYYIVDVMVNGSSVGAVSSYTFTNVQAAYTISATFALTSTPTPTPSPSSTATPTSAPTPTPIPTATPTPTTSSPTPTSSGTTSPAISLGLLLVVGINVAAIISIFTVIAIKKTQKNKSRTVIPIKKIMIKVLFVSVENAGRSQMAEAFAKKYGKDTFIVSSAGNKPADSINPVIIEAMKEKGIDISMNKPKVMTYQMMQNADLVVIMGCARDNYPGPFFKPTIDWALEDPRDKPIEKVREIRDEIERRVKLIIQQSGEQMLGKHE